MAWDRNCNRTAQEFGFSTFSPKFSSAAFQGTCWIQDSKHAKSFMSFEEKFLLLLLFALPLMDHRNPRAYPWKTGQVTGGLHYHVFLVTMLTNSVGIPRMLLAEDGCEIVERIVSSISTAEVHSFWISAPDESLLTMPRAIFTGKPSNIPTSASSFFTAVSTISRSFWYFSVLWISLWLRKIRWHNMSTRLAPFAISSCFRKHLHWKRKGIQLETRVFISCSWFL